MTKLKVRFLQSAVLHSEIGVFNYNDEADIDENLAAVLEKDGVVDILNEKPKKEVKKEVPEKDLETKGKK